MNKVEKILMRIAAENHTSIETIRKEISVAIEIGMNKP